MLFITSHDGFLSQTDAAVFESPIDGYAPGTAFTFPSNAQEVPVTVVDLNVGDDLLPVNVQDQSATIFNPEEFAREFECWHFCNKIIVTRFFTEIYTEFSRVITRCNPSA